MSFQNIVELLFDNRHNIPNGDYVSIMEEIKKLFVVQRRCFKHNVFFSIYYDVRYIDPDDTPNFDETDYDEDALEEYIQSKEVHHRIKFKVDLTEKVEDCYELDKGDHFTCFELFTRRALPFEKPAQILNLISESSSQVADKLIETILALKENGMKILSKDIKNRIVIISPLE